jgi:hypothetical protein
MRKVAGFGNAGGEKPTLSQAQFYQTITAQTGAPRH